MRDITLITGCMFSGKTTRLIELYNTSMAGYDEKLAIKPLIDNRYVAGKIHTHSGLSLPGHRISKAEEIYPLIETQHSEIFIDEVQFLGENLAIVLLDLSLNGVKIVCAGLDRDYLGNDFPAVQKIIPYASAHEKLLAKCTVCGAGAAYTYRTVDSDETILVGHHDIYEARCLGHWEEGNLQRTKK